MKKTNQFEIIGKFEVKIPEFEMKEYKKKQTRLKRAKNMIGSFHLKRYDFFGKFSKLFLWFRGRGSGNENTTEKEKKINKINMKTNEKCYALRCEWRSKENLERV